MKKARFYKTKETGYELVSGYIDTFVDSNGKKIDIGFSGKWFNSRLFGWQVIHIDTGLSIAYAETHRKSVQCVIELMPIITELLQKPYAKKCALKMVEFKKELLKNKKSN